MSDDLSGDMLAPSWPNLVSLVNFVDYFYFNIFIKILYFLPPVFYSMHFEYLILIRKLVDGSENLFNFGV